METINPNIQFFTRLSRAEKYYKNLKCSASLVSLFETPLFGYESPAYVDINPEKLERCHRLWPEKCFLIEEK